MAKKQRFMVCPLLGNMAWKQCYLVYPPFEIESFWKGNFVLSFIIDIIGPTEPIQESEKKPRLSSKRSPSGNNKSPSYATMNEISNDGSEETPPMCSSCSSKGATQLSSDRDKWPIGKIEIGCFQKICKLLDLADWNNEPLISALDGFDRTMAAEIKKKYEANGGLGTAEEVLGKWGSSNHENNVEALQKILKDIVKRVDVFDEIEQWENLSVCHGCGVKLNKSH
jgi:hypothetical protein